ncbi:hypothetical protein, partial [Aeromonas sobria]
MKNGVIEGMVGVEGRASRRFRFAPAIPFAAPIHRGSRWPPRSTVAAAGRPDPPWQPLAAPIHRGSRWP